MDDQKAILSRISGGTSADPLYLPDLTLWYDWHSKKGTLPPDWRGASLPDIARSLGVPAWLPVRPWRTEMQGAQVEVQEDSGERLIRWKSAGGELQARWTLGPDGDWWQTEYPVKSASDLPIALEAIEARTYVLDPSALQAAIPQVGQDGIVALEIPRRPYSDLLHDFLGWSQGLLLLGEPLVLEALDRLEEKLQSLVQEVAGLPGQIVLSPDNLDGQFISPRMFKSHLTSSYGQTCEILSEKNKRLVVHVGGPVRHLIRLLLEAGVDGIEGIAGPPQGNCTLAEARELAGPDITLWGGIPQDMLVETYDEEQLLVAVEQCVQDARGDSRVILGVADRVPVQADLGRLKSLPGLVQQALMTW